MRTSLDLCLRLFPYVLCINLRGEIEYVSSPLANRLKHEPEGQRLNQAFTIHSPPPNSLPCDVITAEHVGKLFLMHTADKEFAVRGQIVEGSLNDKDIFFFVGAPWSSWLYENKRKVSLSSSDYPIQDSQLEHQMYLTTQNMMRADMEELLEELGTARVKAEKASQAKTEFVKHISHEIRTPLNGVITSLELLKDPSQSERYDRLLDIARTSSTALMELVDDVLDFARIEDGNNAVELAEFDLHSLLREIEAAFSPRAIARNIRMRLFIADDLPRRVLSDKRSFQKICFNLISNAIKYSKSELVEISVSYETPNSLRFECVDYGIGISEEDQNKVFEPFWTAPAVRQGDEQSTGLGLSITRELATALGGKLELKSSLGEGSSFVLTFPVEIIEDNSDKSAAPPISEEAALFSGTVLLVDDNAINLELGQILLNRLGLEVHTATNGKEAVAAAMTRTYKLIFMDISMPVMGGIEAAQAILAMPQGEDSAIVALTANVSSDDIASYQRAGMVDTLVKPIEQEALVTLCKRFLPAAAANSSRELRNQQPTEHPMPEKPLLLDAAKLQQLKDDIGAENFERIAQLFVDETTARCEQLKSQLNSGIADTIASSAHRLASSCLAFGLMELGHSLRETENQAKAKNEITLQAEHLSDLCARSLAQLELEMS